MRRKFLLRGIYVLAYIKFKLEKIHKICIYYLRKKIGYKRMADALGYYSDEGRGVPAISFGEVASNL